MSNPEGIPRWFDHFALEEKLRWKGVNFLVSYINPDDGGMMLTPMVTDSMRGAWGQHSITSRFSIGELLPWKQATFKVVNASIHGVSLRILEWRVK